MQDTARATAYKLAPWRRDAAWALVLAEAILALGIGTYVLLVPDSALTVLRVLLSVFLVVNGIAAIMPGLRNADQVDQPGVYLLMAGTVAIALGLVGLFAPVTALIDEPTARITLALGLLGYGLLSLVGTLMRGHITAAWGPLLWAVLNALLGGLVLYSIATQASVSALIGWVCMLAGLGLMAYAGMLYRIRKPATP